MSGWDGMSLRDQESAEAGHEHAGPVRTEAAPPLFRAVDLALMAGVYLTSRVILSQVFSVEVDAWWVNQIHHVPTPILRTDLWRSVYYLHTQPPLWNLVLGLVLKAGGDHWPYYYMAMSLGLGLALQFSLFAIMRQLGIGRMLALIVACAYMMLPQVIAYENLTGYDLMATSGLALLVALFLPAARGKSFWGLAAFTFVASMLVILRSNFHPIILFPWFGVLAWANPSRWRAVVVAALIAAVPCGAVIVKNKLIFGKASMSSWLGMQVVYMLDLDPNDPWLLEQVRSGAVSSLVLRMPLSPLDRYPDVDLGTPPADAPVLTQAKVDGIDNFQAFGYIAVSDQYFKDAKVLLLRRPGLWFRSFGHSLWTYFKSASVNGCFAHHNRGCIGGYVEFIDRWIFLRTRVGSRDAYPGLAAGLILAGLSGVYLMLRGGRPPFSLDHDQRFLVGFMLGNVVFLALIILAFDPHETYRHRTYGDPLSLIFLVTMASRWVRQRFLACP